MKKIYLMLLILLLLLPVTMAKQGHMKLLAVRDTDGNLTGSIADLYLEIREGSGRVFLDTFPLTKVDTQFSTRFAKEVACNYLKKDCSGLDFIYTIRSDSSIVGGPSAGAAVTYLTISLLDNFPADESSAVTGTINSGGIVGPVGGLRAKVDAAAQAGIKRVLIPKGALLSEDNESVDVSAYAEKKKIEIYQISTMDDILEILANRPKPELGNISIDSSYEDTMKILATKLCSKTEELSLEVNSLNKDKENLSRAEELHETGKSAFKEGSFYSAASFCYGANVRFRELSYQFRDVSTLTRKKIISNAEEDIGAMMKLLAASQIQTITDLETYMVVTDRLIEAKKRLNQASEQINSTDSLYELAYGVERIYSAKSWYEFFKHTGKKLNMDQESIKESCKLKISEAEERYQYVNTFLSSSALSSTREGLKLAYEDLNNGEFALCLFKASKAKSEADLILGMMNVEVSQVDMLLEQKLEVAKNTILKQSNNNIFPVLGYSYYEYANSLKEDDPYSSLLYAEYAIELSGLDIYFKDKELNFNIPLDISKLLIFIYGLSVGFVLAFLLFRKRLDIIKITRTKKQKDKKTRKNEMRKVQNRKRPNKTSKH